MITFHTETVEVLTGVTSVDRYGNKSLDWSSPTVTQVEGCRVLPAVGSEVLDRVTGRLVLYAPPATTLQADNRVRYAGVIYDVLGEVRRWASPSGALAHIEADLELVKG